MATQEQGSLIRANIQVGPQSQDIRSRLFGLLPFGKKDKRTPPQALSTNIPPFGSDPPANSISDVDLRESLPGNTMAIDVLLNTPQKEILTPNFMGQAISIYAHPDVITHIDLPASLPTNMDPKSDEFKGAIYDFRDYFRGTKDDKGNILTAGYARDVIAVLAVDRENPETLVLAGDARLRGFNGDIPEGERIALIEKFAVRPDLWRKKIAAVTTARVLDYLFYEYKGYRGEGALEVRAAIFYDSVAEGHDKNSNWVTYMGFDVTSVIVEEDGRRIRRSVIKRKSDNRQILLFGIKKDEWGKRRQELVSEGVIDWPIPNDAASLLD